MFNINREYGVLPIKHSMKKNDNFPSDLFFLFKIELSNDCIIINLIKAKINLVNCNYLRKPSF